MPTPHKDEKEDDFIDRCVTQLIEEEGREPDQAAAMCYRIWDDSEKDKNDTSTSAGTAVSSAVGKRKERNEMSEQTKHRDLFRAGVARGIKDGKSGVDREEGIIYGFAVISKGEAIGHDVEIDDVALDQVVVLGSKLKLGVKSRFGHPNMSNDALGTFLGRSRELRRDGDIVRADLYFDRTAYKTPNGDLAGYVMDLAESDPDAFGASIVFDYELEYRLNEDGTRQKDKQTGKPLMPLIRVKKLWAVDAVDDPAANKGLFNIPFFNDSIKPSAEMTAFLDRFLADPDSVEKAISFLQRYAITRDEMENTDQIKKEEGEDMELKDVTLEMLKAGRPDLVEALSSQAQEKALKEGKEDGIKLERERVAAILKKAEAFEGMADITLEAVEKGDSIEAADGKFKAKRIKQLESNAPKSPGPSDGDQTHVDTSKLSVEEKAEHEWNTKPELKEEFTSKEAYIAFRKAEEKGQVKIVKK